ncbi:protein kinase [Streptomyces sp. NBC_00249]|uniref:protein kinase domain-containing protein n=1 Tax=Streptomyces sp. NBC_00249 TaxID=2975690 RepID=UPI002253C240|nr:protein kinase [Streptomyces sp. NBC_00249]MCX5195449.1 protein kinase [Streptomyces sp. NBC_00249]
MITTGPVAGLRPGDPAVLGAWRLAGVLGEGGMGTVYLGRDGRRVGAVKTLKAGLTADPHLLARFRRELEATGAARSPYLPRLLGADLSGAVPWMATEFVAGPTLEQCVEGRGPLPADTVRQLGAMLASALDALHRAGAVHRDLKPSNVLLAVDGPRLVDLGIARMPGRTTLTLTGQRPGSAGYMSPEQVMGREPGPPGDVFTLGALLVYASTGHHAFEGGPALADYRIVHEEPDLSRVPDPPAALVRRCLDKDPGRRPAPAELAARWQAPARRGPAGWLPEDVARDIETIRRRTARAAGQRPARMGRRRILGLTGAAAVLATGGGAAWRWYGATTARETGTVPLWDGAPGERPEPLWSVTGLDPEVPFGPARAGGVLLVAHTGRVSALDPRTGNRLWSYAGGRAPAPSAPWPVLIGPDGVLRAFEPRTGEVNGQGPDGLARILAADADTVYAADTAGHLVAVRHGTRAPLWRSRDPLAPAGAVAAAGAGQVLVTLADGATHALDPATGERRWAAPGGKGGLPAAPDTALTVLGGPTLRGLLPADGTRRWEVRPIGVTGGFGAPRIHDGHVYVADDDVVRCLRLADGADVRQLTGAGGGYAPAQPVAAAHGLYVPLAVAAAGIAAFPLTGDAERYRFAPAAERDRICEVAAVEPVMAVQSGDRLYGLPQF